MTSNHTSDPNPSWAEPVTSETPESTILIVDDSPMDRHRAGSIIQKLGGWQVRYASHGIEALSTLEQQIPDVVLTDMQMPEMGGLELVQTICRTYPGLPVILMTAHGSEEIAIQALRQGAASYIPKKSLQNAIAGTLEQVLVASQSQRSQQRILDSLTKLESEFSLENDTSLVGPLVGHLEEGLKTLKRSEPSGLLLLGVALHEALTNAILHGNLELDSSLRETEEKRYYEIAQQRRGQPPYCERRVSIQATLTHDEATFVIRDQGKGFDPSTLPDPTDPANLGRVSGRGLILIQAFMDRVYHNEVGNEITMVKKWTLTNGLAEAESALQEATEVLEPDQDRGP
jgi:CheY-like chemotaxis protein/anti-sigma regulatory factor (Ser/Thr protein kinase)